MITYVNGCYVIYFVQSEGELKLNRITTLPSISENNEETDSDTNDLKNESPGSPDSNQEGSPASPFLKKTFRFPVPNGDVLSRYYSFYTFPCKVLWNVICLLVIILSVCTASDSDIICMYGL